MILFSVQSLRLAAVVADLEIQDSKAELPEVLAAVDLKTMQEAQETHQQHLQLKVATAAQAARVRHMTAAAVAGRLLLAGLEPEQITQALVAQVQRHQ